MCLCLPKAPPCCARTCCGISCAARGLPRSARPPRPSRSAAGKVTGFIGEFFGAAQAVKVANAEGSVIAHFNRINDERRRLSLREHLFGAVLDALYNNTAILGTGIVLILARA